MAGRRAGAGLALAALALTAAGCSLGNSTKTVTTTRVRTVTTVRTVTSTSTGSSQSNASACTGSQLSGTFDLVAGSGGAGQIAYTLTLTNTSQTACWVSGLPQAQLLGSSGNALPTHISAAQPGTATAAKVTLNPGAAAAARAQFSPDVSGQGDATSGPCQPKAHTLRVTADGGGTVDAPVSPPTSVCERGTLNFDLLAATG
jgi:hypothetical protein